MIRAILVDAGGVLYLNNKGMGYVNSALLEFIKSNQEKYIFGVISTTEYDLKEILKKDEIDILFKVVLTSGETRLDKTEAGIYEEALFIIDLKPEEVIFIDNDESYLKVASSLGIKTIFYDGDFDLCRKEIERASP